MPLTFYKAKGKSKKAKGKSADAPSRAELLTLLPFLHFCLLPFYFCLYLTPLGLEGFRVVKFTRRGRPTRRAVPP
jgi:hypothetical protein